MFVEHIFMRHYGVHMNLLQVRQKEKGLRGSWHPGVVVKVWSGRRSVEYDELLSKDGINKLRECIPVPRGVEGVSQHMSRLPAQKERGFIRPRPPSCTEMPKDSWKKGLWVDAFYEDAWWEGILLEDVLLTTDEYQVTVFFPDEGDEIRIPLQGLRARQEWDDETSFWSIKGYAVPEVIGETSLTLETHEEVNKREGYDSSVRTSTLASQEHTEQRKSQGVLMQSPCSGSQEMMDATGMVDCKENQIDCSSTPKLGTIDHNEGQTDCSSMPNLGLINHKESQTICFSTPKINSTSQLGSSNDEHWEKEETLAEWMTTAKRQVLRGRVVAKDKYGSSDDVANKDLNMNQGNACETIADTTKLANHHKTCMNELGNNIGNLENFVCNKSKSKRSDPLKGKARKCRLGNNRNKYSTIVSSDIIREIRDRAKKTLQEAGWNLHFRWWNGCRKVAYYISPEGVKYSSLSAACTEWRRLQGSGISTNAQNENGVLQILNGHIQSKGINWTEEPCNNEKKVLKATHKQVTLTSSKPLSSPKTNENCEIGVFWPLQDRRYTLCFENCARQKKTKPTELPLSSHSCHDKSFKYKSNRLHSLNVTEQSFRKRKHNVLEGSPRETVKVKRRRRASEITKPMLSLKKSRARSGCRLEVLLSAPGRGRADEGSAVSSSKRTIISWLIDMGVVAENEKVRYLSRKEKHVMMEGQVTRDGVWCKCCKMVWTLSDFELHAGSKLRRPCANIFVSDGRSLSECQMQALKIKDAAKSPCKASHESNNGDPDGSDDTCGICGDGGELICCDHCPSTFHLNCVQVENVPKDDWYCPYCRCAVCHDSKFSVGESFDETAVLCCDQCGREYHVVCLYARGMPKMDRCPKNNQFCGHVCHKIFEGLRGLVGTTNALEDGFSWTLLRSTEEDPLSTTEYSLEVVAEHNSKLAIALTVMQECFRPMIDTRTKIELISHILYNRGSELNRLNFRGFYTLLLERGDELISVASIRVHGARLAEMPLIGTRFQYRRQGMCRRLMNALELMLQNLRIQTLVLPAVPELLETWTNAFGFEPMTPSERFEFVGFSISAFPGTTLLQKSLANPKLGIVEPISASGTSLDVTLNSCHALPADWNEFEGKKTEVLTEPVWKSNSSTYLLPDKSSFPIRSEEDSANQVSLSDPLLSLSKGLFGERPLNGLPLKADEDVEIKTVDSLKGRLMPNYDQGRISGTSFDCREDLDIKLSPQIGNLDDPSCVGEGLNFFSFAPTKSNLHMVLEQGASNQEPELSNNHHDNKKQQEIGISGDKKDDDLSSKVIVAKKLSEPFAESSHWVAKAIDVMPRDSVKQVSQMRNKLKIIPFKDHGLYNQTRVIRYGEEPKRQWNKRGGRQGCRGIPAGIPLLRNLEAVDLSNKVVSSAVYTSVSNSIACRATDMPTMLSLPSLKAVLGEQVCLTGIQTLKSDQMLLRSSLEGNQTVSSDNEVGADSKMNGRATVRIKIGWKMTQQTTDGNKIQKPEGNFTLSNILGETESASLSTFDECKHEDPEFAPNQDSSLEKVEVALLTRSPPIPISSDNVMAREIIQTAEMARSIPGDSMEDGALQ
ncbi:hypothetical protein O6H91_04G036300 [Diphasiastrum complanatum]|uniref:Uncharacterized protein n=1 Tax=Diphasiastrum complanatum TaxID=34168 RepID=A0ACC2DVS6_DIPCM|nr:hypothetical protein O6H91_04G036300 [Diphasiastrum complanatum]